MNEDNGAIVRLGLELQQALKWFYVAAGRSECMDNACAASVIAID
jgi:hypothetical protein